MSNTFPAIWLSEKQAAAYLGIGKTLLREGTPRLPSHRVGRRRLYNRPELDLFILSGTLQHPAAVSPAA